MLKIAICDDDKVFSSEVETIIQAESINKGLRAEIEVFYDGFNLLKSIQKGATYNIIFLDIEMKHLDGLATARKIRMVDSTVLIIYISGYDDYLKELFEVEPFRFISKPMDQEKLKKYFRDACNRLQENEEYYQFTFNKELQRYPLNDIVYFESKSRAIYIHFKDGTSTYYYGKLKDVEKGLQDARIIFIRIHQSYYVNYNYIKRINFSYITVHFHNQDIDLKISEDRQKSIKNTILQLAENKISV